MFKNVIKADRPQRTVRRMRFACWINEATNTESEYVMQIAFRRQQWLHERASVLPDSSFACVGFFQTRGSFNTRLPQKSVVHPWCVYLIARLETSFLSSAGKW